MAGNFDIESVKKGLTGLEDTISGVSDVVSGFQGIMSGLGESLGQTGSIEAMAGAFERLESQISGLDLSNLNDFSGFSDVLNVVISGASGVASGISSITACIGGIAPVFESATSVFQNFQNGILKGFGKFGELIGNMVPNFSGGLQELINKIMTITPALMSAFNMVGVMAVFVVGLGLMQQLFGEQITAFLQMATEQGPQIISNLCQGIVSAIPQLIEQGTILLTNLLNAIIANLPALMDGGFQIIATLVASMSEQFPTLIPLALTLVMTFINGLINNLPKIINAGMQILKNLVTGIINCIPELISKTPEVINNFISTVLKMLPQILQTGKETLLELVHGIVNAIPDLVDAIPRIITSFIETIGDNLPQILQTGIEVIGELVAGLLEAIPNIVGAIPEIITSIREGFENVDWLEIGMNIITGIAKGVVDFASNVVDAAVNAAKDAVNAVKGWLGIASPSKVFRDEIGKYMALGIGVGFDENMPTHDLQRNMEEMLGDLNSTIWQSGLHLGDSVAERQSEHFGAASMVSIQNAQGSQASVHSPERGYQAMKQVILDAISESGLDKNMARGVSRAMENVGIYCDMRQIGRLRFE